jgi:hypothetical protein
MSAGFHYFETMNVSLQLQLLPKAEAPRHGAHVCLIDRG